MITAVTDLKEYQRFEQNPFVRKETCSDHVSFSFSFIFSDEGPLLETLITFEISYASYQPFNFLPYLEDSVFVIEIKSVVCRCCSRFKFILSFLSSKIWGQEPSGTWWILALRSLTKWNSKYYCQRQKLLKWFSEWMT